MAPSLARLAATGALVLVVGRWVAVATLEASLWSIGALNRPHAAWEPAGWAATVTLGAIAVGTALADHQRQLALPGGHALRTRAWALALLLFAVPTAVRAWGHTQGFFSWGFVDSWQAGRFPFPAGQDQPFERNGYEATAHIRADGFRVCTPGDRPQQGAHTVTLLGDSMIFGLAIPDEDTLCWRLRERFEAQAPGALVFRNAGQPGASLHSYVRTFDWLMAEHGTDTLVVGLLVPNDAEVFDVNHHRGLVRSPLFRVAGTLLDPHAVMAAVLAFGKKWRAEFFDHARIEDGLRDLAAAAERHGVPTLVFIYDLPELPHARHGFFSAYDDLARRIAEESPVVDYLGVFSEPDEPADPPYRIPDDGHPTGAGNRLLTAWLAPAVATLTGTAP